MVRHRRLPNDVPPARISAANLREARQLFGYLSPYTLSQLQFHLSEDPP